MIVCNNFYQLSNLDSNTCYKPSPFHEHFSCMTEYKKPNEPEQVLIKTDISPLDRWSRDLGNYKSFEIFQILKSCQKYR